LLDLVEQLSVDAGVSATAERVDLRRHLLGLLASPHYPTARS